MMLQPTSQLRNIHSVHRHRPAIPHGTVNVSLRLGLHQACSQGRLRRRLSTKAAIGQTATSKGGGGSDDGTGGRGMGGSGGGDDGEKGDKSGSGGLSLWKGWQDRVQCDPAFPSKVLIEQIIGVGAAVLGDMSSRPNWGIYELDFVFSTLVVGSIVNFMLMYCLAATPASSAAVKGSLIQKLFSEQTLKNMGAPGGHMFEKGYSLSARATNWIYKGFLFGFVGICSGLLGTSMSNGLILMRKRFDPNFEQQNKSPNIVMNALAWGTHMSVSSNTRYQMLYGLDTVLMPRMGSKVFLAYSAIIRTLNNMVGGTSFVFCARLLGVQKVNEEGLEESPK